MRLHKEAPETLRFGFRRASKGHGTRITRQCAVSSGVAAAWAAAGGDTAAAVAAGGDRLPNTQKEAGSAVGETAVTPVDRARMTPANVSPTESDAARRSGSADDEPVGHGSWVPEEGRRHDATGLAGTALSRCTSPPVSRNAEALGSASPGKPDQQAREALSEVVRMSMAMFDKMCERGEKLDLTLLSVGFAGFRSMGGGAQAGMARCVYM